MKKLMCFFLVLMIVGGAFGSISALAEGSNLIAPANGKPGWVKEGGLWYYYDSYGSKCIGWIKPGGVWYYMDPETPGLFPENTAV